MIKIGITGNIASGKSEVEKILKNEGYSVFNFDDMTHELFSDEEVKKKLKKEFNTTIRSEISQIVFRDMSKIRFLEELFHPILKKRTLELFEEHKEEKLVFFSGALIYEAGFDKLFDKIIFVDADFMLRLKRLKQRNNLNDKDAMNRLNCQSDKFKSKADFVIFNNDTEDKLKNETIKVLNCLI